MRTGCRAETKTGRACQMAPLMGSEWCFAHDPHRTADRARARRRGGLNRRTPKARVDVLGVPRLRSVDAVQDLLDGAVRDTLLQENSGQRSRALGYLAGLVLKSLEVGQIENRLSELEDRVRIDERVSTRRSR